MSMLDWVKKDNCPNLIIFVHGLKGDGTTWYYDDIVSFPLLLKDEKEVIGTHDIACFEYFTTFTNTYGNAKGWVESIFTSLRKKRKNLPIEELGELLKTEIEINLTGYQNIIIIAHSMGGLVAKSCILKQLREDKGTKVKGFISLAVPHSGAFLANVADLITSNVQIKDLSVFSDAIDSLSREWIHATQKPIIKYIYATHDQYVKKKSAVPIDSRPSESIGVDEDHNSICKPKNKSQTVYNAVLKYISAFYEGYAEPLELRELLNLNQYDDEYFVLKMVIADIHENTTSHAKEYFYNAELVRKIFTSEYDRKKLAELYLKVKHVYQEEYEKYIAGNSTSDALIAAVHSRIMNESDNYLISYLIPKIDSVHKKGMLHQLANNCNKAIMWSRSLDLEELERLKDK